MMHLRQLDKRLTSFGRLRPLAWAALAIFLVAWQGQFVWDALLPPRNVPQDFYQEWASARNFRHGRPLYLPQDQTVPDYLGVPARPGRMFIEVNAHPPSAVLLALPLAALDYPTAHFVWNLFSLTALVVSGSLIVRELGLPLHAGFWAALVFVLVSAPLCQQFIQGQFNLFLLLLMTGVWLADRKDRPWWAGVLLGVASAVKVLPGLLFLYFILRRRWQTVLAGAVALAAAGLTTLAVFGPGAFTAYLTEASPKVGEWRSHWMNFSLSGFFARLFDPGTKGSRVEPLFISPTLAHSLTLVGDVLVLVLLTWAVLRARLRSECDLAFGLVVLAIILVSPVAWDHYFVMLLLPLAILWQRLPVAGLQRWVFWGLVLVLWQPMWRFHILGGHLFEYGTAHAATPAQNVTAFALPFYAVLGLVTLNLLALRAARRQQEAASNEGESIWGNRVVVLGEGPVGSARRLASLHPEG